ncbi:MAG: glutaminyl-peptide cyclotransferase [Sphingobacteriales bacterium]|jgi:glutamine cyclotransferase
MKWNFFLALIVSILFLACNNPDSTSKTVEESDVSSVPEAPAIPYTILNAYPHDTSAFTQGLEFYKGQLYESTGLEGRSTLRTVDLKTGAVKQLHKLAPKEFGEGITVLNDTLYQLTWENHIVFVYDPKTLKLIRQMTWNGEGWGITNNGKSLILSDGSDKLYFCRPSDLKLEKVLSVTDHLGPLNNLNELEYVNGSVYANRIEYNYIVKINPSNGFVTGKLDFTDILKKYAKIDLTYIQTNPHGAVLNGIAWNPENKKMYITGKLWPLLFELDMQP